MGNSVLPMSGSRLMGDCAGDKTSSPRRRQDALTRLSAASLRVHSLEVDEQERTKVLWTPDLAHT